MVIFRSTSLKLDWLNWKLEIDFKMVSVLKIRLQTIYTLAIANQTTRPNWLKFFNGTQGYPGDNKGYKHSIFFEDLNYFTNFLIIFFNQRATPGTSVSYKRIYYI